MQITLDPFKPEHYDTFIQAKQLPRYRVIGHTIEFPDEYADRLGIAPPAERNTDYQPAPHLFDYQADITQMAIRKGKFCVFADCGLGKTLIMLEYARHVSEQFRRDESILIVSPLMVIHQTINEAAKFYGDEIVIEQVTAKNLPSWTKGPSAKVGITNYEALSDEVEQGQVRGLILDESSMLKSHYGKWGTKCLELGRGLQWKLAMTGTPAPNDRIEYANHAVFMDAFPNVNSFLARYFVNRGQTDNRWELKPHALEPFYKALSHWSIFVVNPGRYGWTDNTEPPPPIYTHIHDVPLTDEQEDLVYDKTGSLFANQVGGISSRSVLGQIAKGNHKSQYVPTNKPKVIRELADSWPNESTIIWCLYNAEQDLLAEWFPEAANIEGTTPHEKRQKSIDEFKSGQRKILITKPRVLGFGLNLQVATRHIFSGLQDSYEAYYQAVKRSNRYGATRPLNVHIPVTDIEKPMVETVLAKADRVQKDTEHQEEVFLNAINV